jgi:hypothetical protein
MPNSYSSFSFLFMVADSQRQGMKWLQSRSMVSDCEPVGRIRIFVSHKRLRKQGAPSASWGAYDGLANKYICPTSSPLGLRAFHPKDGSAEAVRLGAVADESLPSAVALCASVRVAAFAECGAAPSAVFAVHWRFSWPLVL